MVAREEARGEATTGSHGTMPTTLTIGVAGGTGAGKTTLARRLFEELGGDENVAYLVHDSYYLDCSHKPVSERAKTNFDHPESLDTDLLVDHIIRLKAGEAVDVPQYNFSTHSRCHETTRQVPRRIILVEGILIFCNPDLVSQFDLKVFVDAPADVRLMRRIRRDCEERGRTSSDVLEQYHATVRPMHEAFVEPSKVHADIIIPNGGGSELLTRGTGPLDKAVHVISNHAKAMLIDHAADEGGADF